MNPRDYPSCSGLGALALCPGKFQAERGLPDNQNDDSESGTAIHASLALNTIRPLTPEEGEVAFQCDQRRAELIQSVFGRQDNLGLVFEKRLWSHGVGFVWSGQADLIVSDGEKALVIDYKTGRHPTPEAADNLQLAGLALLVADNYGVAPVTAAIIAPRQAKQVTVTTYDRAALKDAKERINEILRAASKKAAPRIVGPEQCRYCRAAGTDRCPESLESVVHTAAIVPTAIPTAGPLAPASLSKLLDSCEVAEDIITKIREAARKMLESGTDVPGWHLKPGAVRQTITDPQKVFEAAASRGVTTSDFLKCVSVTKGKLETAVRDATGSKGKALDAAMQVILDGAVEEKQTKPSLCRV